MDRSEDSDDSQSEKSYFYNDDMSYMGYDEDSEEDGTHGLVRAIVSNEDDTSLPILTFRFWIIGTVFIILISIANTIAAVSSSPISISVIIAQLFAYPLGNLMAKYLPNKEIGFGKYTFSLNPGPFNIKEHTAITIYTGLSSGISDVIVLYLQGNILYRSSWSASASLLLLCSSSLTGIGIQKFTGEYLVKSPDMIFPAVLVTITLLRSLHDKNNTGLSKRFSGIKFVLLVALASAIYHFVPKIFIQVLQYLSVLCYIFPKSQIVHQLSSGFAGLGIGSISLDWNVITRYGMAPLIMPLWSAANAFVGFVISAWIITPLLYYTNVLNFAYFPIYSNNLYNMYGGVYRSDNVLGLNNKLDVQKYLNYSPLKLNVSIFMAYFFSFAGIIALAVHFLLNYTSDLMSYMQNVIIESKKVVGGFGDIHNRLMKHYRTVPTWWSVMLFIVCLAGSLIGCELTLGEIKWYVCLFAIAVGVAMFIPIAIVYAISNLRSEPSVILQAFVGYLYPGRPVGNLGARYFGNIIVSQAVQSAENFKMGHYMKLPPRQMYMIQIVGTLLSVLTSFTTIKVLQTRAPDLCDRNSRNWNCSRINTLFSASNIWGLFGPSELFDIGREYSSLWISIGVGVLAPVLTFLLSKKYPGTWISFIHTPIIFIAASQFPPNTSSALISAFILSFVFNFYLYRYKHGWWTNYNYLLSTGLDLGAIVTVVIIGLLGSKVPTINWAGNDQFGGCSLAIKPHIINGAQ